MWGRRQARFELRSSLQIVPRILRYSNSQPRGDLAPEASWKQGETLWKQGDVLQLGSRALVHALTATLSPARALRDLNSLHN